MKIGCISLTSFADCFASRVGLGALWRSASPLVFLVLVCSSLSAGGYTFRDGFYWQGNRAFTRVSDSYWHNGRWCQRYSYRFHHEYTAPVQVVQKLEAKKLDIDDFRLEALRLAVEDAEQRAKTEQAAEIMGLLGKVAPNQVQQLQGQGVQGQYAYRLTNTRTPLADQGSTLYGVNSFANQYPEVDLKLHLNQASNLAENAQRLSGQATNEFSQLILQIADLQQQGKSADSKTAQILAVAQLLAALDAKSETTIEATPVIPSQSNNHHTSSGGGSEPPPQAFDSSALLSVVTEKCSRCHSSEKADGDLNLDNILTFTAEQSRDLVNRVLSTDESLRMPKGGNPLSIEEAQHFVDFYKSRLGGD